MVTKEYAELHPEENLGRDVALNGRADIFINSKNDLAQIRYDPNLTQAIIDRLKTQIGENTLHINYGSRLYELVGASPDSLSLPTARMHVREALLQEPRIEEIIEITANWRDNNKDSIEVGITVKPITDLANLNLIYELFI